jgi:hypothetical protein
VITTDEVVTHVAANGAAPTRKGFANLKQRHKVVTVEFGGMTGDVWYRPWVMTPRVLREMLAEQGEDDTRDNPAKIMDQIVLYVEKWDVLDEDGNELPVAVDAMEEHLPIEFLVAVVQAIREDMQPTPTSGDGSSAGSSTDATA